MFRIGFFSLTTCLCLFLASVSLAAQSAQPAWINNPYANFDSQTHVVAVGAGDSRQAAEMDALHGIASVFHLNIQAVERLTTLYRGAITDGATAWTQQTDLGTAIKISVEMENLIGARIRQYWDNGSGTHFVLAVLYKPTAMDIYSQRIRANLDIIRNLTYMMPATQRNTFDGFSRYQFAAIFADMSFTYGQILTVLGRPWREPLRTGDWYLQRSREILAEIPIGINVRNDRGQRIQGAFARTLADLGFRSGGTNPRFVLDVNVNAWRENPLPGTEFAWVEISANLIDTNTRAVLVPYSFNLRSQPRSTIQVAENLAFNAAVRRIDREYGNLVSEYLAQLVPRR